MGIFSAIGNFSVGALKGLGSTVSTVGEIGEKGIRAVLPGMRPSDVQLGKTEKDLANLGVKNAFTPTTKAQKVGFAAEQIGEFFIPGGAARTGAVKLGAKVSPAISAAARAGAGATRGQRALVAGTKLAGESAGQAAVSLAQTGDVKEAGITGAVNIAATPVISGGAKVLGQVAKTVASALSSVPSEAIEQAFKNPKTVRRIIREAASDPDAMQNEVINRAVSAFDDVKEARRQTYVKNLRNIQDQTFTTRGGQLYVKKFDQELGSEAFVPTNLSLKGVKDRVTDVLKNDFRASAKGRSVDLSSSTFGSSANRTVKQIVSDIYDWKDITPIGMDTLLQKLEDYRPSGVNIQGSDAKIAAFITAVKKNLNEYVNDRVPQVAKLRKDYAAQSEFIGKLRDELYSGKESTVATRLQNIFSPKKASQRALAEELSRATGKDILSELAGTLLSRWTPEGLGKYVTTSLALPGAAGISSAVSGGVITPAVLPAAAAAAIGSSPRLVGEAATMAGQAVPTISQGLAAVRPAASALAGKMTNLADSGNDDLTDRYPEYKKQIEEARRQGVPDGEIDLYLQSKLSN